MKPSAGRSMLCDSDRRWLESWLADFEDNWAPGRLASQVKALPARGAAIRPTALAELVILDLQLQWQHGKRLRLEAYLQHYPELGTADTVAIDLIQAEVEARAQRGMPFNAGKFAERFPYHIEELRRLNGAPSNGVAGVEVAPPKCPGSRLPRQDRRAQVQTAPVRPDDGSLHAEPTGRRALWPWVALVGSVAALALAIVVAVIVLRQPKAGANSGPDDPPISGSSSAAATPRDADYENTALAPIDERRVLMHFDQASEVDAVGDARTTMVIKLERARHEFVRGLLTHQAAGERLFPIPLRMRNVLDYMDLDATGSLLQDIGGEFGKDDIRVRMRETGFARHQAGHWIYQLSNDPSVPYELVRKEHSKIVTVRALRRIGTVLVLMRAVITLPEGAHDIQVVGKPSQLVYQLPLPSAKAGATAQPTFRLEAKPHLISALYRLYGDSRFPKYWAVRSAFRNASAETMTDYRVRYRIPGYADWSDWQRCDAVYPGQTVVDAYQPALNAARVRELHAPVPVTIEAEYEYVRPDGSTVRAQSSAPTKLLGFNDGIYTDVKLGWDSPWCELTKGMPYLLASFTAGKDPVMQAASALALKAAGGGAPKESDQAAKKYLKAAYDLMRRNITYETAEGKNIDGVPRQLLKYGRDVLRTKKGTCVNTSILFASLAEAAGLEPVIIVIPGHAFAGVQLPKSREPFFVETTGGTTTANAPFDRATAVAKNEFTKAMKSGLFMTVSITALRAMGVMPPELADVGDDALARWKITPPDAAEGAAAAQRADTPPLGPEAKTAEIISARKDPDVVRDGLKGMAFHVHLTIKHSKAAPYLLVVVCVDENKELVRTDLEGYSVQGRLANVVDVTPLNKGDNAEWEDVVLFIPYKGLNAGPGTHHFVAHITVLSDGKVESGPATVPFQIGPGARRRHRFVTH